MPQLIQVVADFLCDSIGVAEAPPDGFAYDMPAVVGEHSVPCNVLSAEPTTDILMVPAIDFYVDTNTPFDQRPVANS